MHSHNPFSHFESNSVAFSTFKCCAAITTIYSGNIFTTRKRNPTLTQHSLHPSPGPAASDPLPISREVRVLDTAMDGNSPWREVWLLIQHPVFQAPPASFSRLHSTPIAS